MSDMKDIERLTREYSARRDELLQTASAMQADLQSVKDGYQGDIRRSVRRTMDAQARLAAAILDARELFERPRTQVFAGIKVGMQKQPGRLEFDDPVKLAKRVNSTFPEQFGALIKTTYTPIKTALALLPSADLRRLGCTLTDTADEVLIKPVDGEADKLINALLKDELTEVEG